CMGVVVGMLTKDPEDNALYTNFIIMPMAFFSGSFFPVDRLPSLVRGIVTVMPLHYTNILMRSREITGREGTAVVILLVCSLALFLYGARRIRNYSE
ncbi:MAG: ABC transporter permease, partial [Nitrospirales bacterium]|nr:ABC transporter permease [Nitrospirales bacterium]